jgi:hypothetical protein
MQKWKITGTLATLIIVFSLPLYVLKEQNRPAAQEEINSATFVTSQACAKCHKKEYEDWQDSHHARAMTVASDETVLGNFENVIFEKQGVQSRFYRRDGRFFVNTRGPKGEMAEFEITQTFGWYHQQQ